MVLTLIAAARSPDRIEVAVQAAPERFVQDIGDVVYNRTYEYSIYRRLQEAMDNGGHLHYPIFVGASGVSLQCERICGTYVVAIQYHADNIHSRRNMLGVIQALKSRLSYEPEAISLLESQLGSAAPTARG